MTRPNRLEFEPLAGQVGAVVRGATLSGSPDDALVTSVTEGLDRYQVLVFEDQDLAAGELRDFTARLGPLFLHHEDTGVLHVDGVPEVLEMRKEPDGERLFGGSDWHADVTFLDPAGYASVLHAKIIPPVGGDTGFASTVAAFDALSDGMKQMLRGLRAVHSYDGPDAPDREGLTATHPVVRVNPATGVEGLYLNEMFVTRFEDMTSDESRPLIRYLAAHMTRPEFTCRVRWKPGHVVMWDNRFSLHYPINDFTGEARLLLRCTALERTFDH